MPFTRDVSFLTKDFYRLQEIIYGHTAWLGDQPTKSDAFTEFYLTNALQYRYLSSTVNSIEYSDEQNTWTDFTGALIQG